MGTDLLQLSDGRQLAFEQYGDPAGFPVISSHGGLTSRLDIRGCDAAARAIGVRVISPDRPGVGRSDRRRGRRLLDWPADVVALADELGLSRFAVLGWSAGGPYAAACAFALPERVSALGLVASALPGPLMVGELHLVDRCLMSLSLRAPALVGVACGPTSRMAERWPAAFHSLSLVMFDGPSRRVVRAMSAAEYAEPIAEGVRQHGGVVDDYRILAGQWGFDPGGIVAPSYIWQGDRDGFVPEHWGEWLAARIETAELIRCPGEGHFLAQGRYREILTTISRQR